MKKYFNYFVIFLSLNFAFSTQVLSADCADASGTTVTISTSCTALSISGDVTNLTINSGITIDKAGKGAVSIGNNTVTTLTNNGTIKTTSSHYGLRHTGSGLITTLINNGSITAAERYGLSTGSSATITTITNSGTISAGSHSGLRNFSGEIGTITNSGTISAGTQYGLINNSGTIGTVTNSGTISSGGAGAAGAADADDDADGDDYDNGLWNDGTITTLTNSGFIKAGDEFGLKNVNGGTITTLNNSGTISAGTNFGIKNDKSASPTTISSLDNSGFIKALRGHSGLWNDGTITTLTNSGTISAGTDNGIKNIGTITTLTNSGTISAGDEYGIWNESDTNGARIGTITKLTNKSTGEIKAARVGIYNKNNSIITTLTNRGTIRATGSDPIGIYNKSSTITTLNNLQGKNTDSPLTYKGTLPTNYNVIVNGTNDYGKTTFSDVSGTTNFGVDLSSTLVADTTYSSVLSDLSSSDITITLEKGHTSPSSLIGLTRYYWTLENSSGSLWDLKITDAINITTDTNTSVTSSVKPNVILGINNLTSVTEVNFANMNTYDCDLFDKNNICLSLGGRHTAINTPKTRANSAVLVGGYKLSDTLRVAGFYHRNLSHKTPVSFKLSDKTPMTGGLVVWNQNPNKLGYQLKLANAYQQKNATLTREVLGSSEEGKGQTVIEAESYVAELQYGYQFSTDTVMHPYLAARSAVIKQGAYTETGNSSPLSFNEIKDKSTTVLLGLKFNTHLSHNLSLKGSLGVEHDIEHSVDKLAPTGISGLSTVSLTDSFNKTRPVVSLGFDYALKPNHRLSGILQYQELPYESKTESNAYLYYTIGF